MDLVSESIIWRLVAVATATIPDASPDARDARALRAASLSGQAGSVLLFLGSFGRRETFRKFLGKSAGIRMRPLSCAWSAHGLTRILDY